jgi:hypothetical protein
MITNMIAVLLVSFTTNWITVSTTTPVVQPGDTFNLVYRPATDHQVGTIYSNTIMTVDYKGTKVTAVLESVPVSHVERDVTHDNIVSVPYNVPAGWPF